MKLKDIAQGWYNYIAGGPEVKALALKRLDVCDSCEWKQQVNGAAQIVLSATNDKNNLFRCGVCNCPLGALASVSRPACKRGKWDHIR